MSKILIICFVFLFSAPATAAQYLVSEGSFLDQSRNRNIAYKLYAPDNVHAAAPVVIFSHGLGGSVDAAPYLGQALAQNGYYAFFIQHQGSDKSVWAGGNKLSAKAALIKSIKNPKTAIARYEDIPFVLDQLALLNSKSGALYKKLDLNKIGMAGHSYGARSVLMAAGELGRLTSFKDPRIKAAVALSPNVPMWVEKKGVKNLNYLYKNIDIPLFHITGTKDGNPMARLSGFDPATRTLPYKNIKTSYQYLLVLDGAEHADFGGRKNKNAKSNHVKDAVAKGTVLFFDVYLKGSTESESYLKSNYKATLNPKDHFEFK